MTSRYAISFRVSKIGTLLATITSQRGNNPQKREVNYEQDAYSFWSTAVNELMPGSELVISTTRLG